MTRLDNITIIFSDPCFPLQRENPVGSGNSQLPGGRTHNTPLLSQIPGTKGRHTGQIKASNCWGNSKDPLKCWKGVPHGERVRNSFTQGPV